MSGPEAPFGPPGGAGDLEPDAAPVELERPAADAEDLDDVIARAVDRQIDEQRALRETLDELRSAIAELRAAEPPAPIDIEDLREHVRREVQTSAETVRSDMRDLRDTLLPGLQRAADGTAALNALEEDVASLKDSVGAVSSDLAGIADALIELNSGLRDWADGLDRKMLDIRETVERVRQAVQTAAAEDGASPEIEQRLKETMELSLYLADQIEGFDRTIRGMGDLPNTLEGVISQALRRTLTARTKLDAEVAATLDDALAGVDAYLDRLGSTVENLSNSDEALSSLAEGQEDLATQIDSLFGSLLERMDALEAGRKPPAQRGAKATPRKKPSRGRGSSGRSAGG